MGQEYGAGPPCAGLWQEGILKKARVARHEARRRALKRGQDLAGDLGTAQTMVSSKKHYEFWSFLKEQWEASKEC